MAEPHGGTARLGARPGDGGPAARSDLVPDLGPDLSTGPSRPDRPRAPVLLPSDEAYADEVSGFQTGYRHRPDVVVPATAAADVSAAVQYAAAHRLPLAVQATGHGLSLPLPGGVLVSTRRMTRVRVDACARTAWIEAGVRWGAVVEEAARYGLAPLSGSGPGVGAVSYTLNGGVGLLAREFGYAADHVRSAELVTADARVRHVTADSDPELFWALRGGGGGFGVVTGLEIGLVPVERFYGGQLIYDGELAEEVLEAWRAWTATVPEELTSSVTLLCYPDLPVLPARLRGRYAVQVQIAYSPRAGGLGGAPSGEAEGERLVAPLRAVGPRISETLRTMPYSESASVYSEPDRPHSYQGGNALLGERLPDPSALRSVLELTGPDAPAMTVLSLRHMGGALSREPAVPNAVPGRDAGWLMVVLSVLPVPEEESGGDAAAVGQGPGAGPEELRGLQERVLETVSPWTVGSSLNFRYGRSARAVPGGAEAMYAPDVDRRLAEVKASADPSNLFRFHAGALRGARWPEQR